MFGILRLKRVNMFSCTLSLSHTCHVYVMKTRFFNLDPGKRTLYIFVLNPGYAKQSIRATLGIYSVMNTVKPLPGILNLVLHIPNGTSVTRKRQDETYYYLLLRKNRTLTLIRFYQRIVKRIWNSFFESNRTRAQLINLS